MTLLSFKQKLYSTLEGHYPATEIGTFFRMILEDILNLSKVDFALNPNMDINAEECIKIEAIIKGLQDYTPIQYLIGFVDYMDFKLEVNSNVLIPRPETEELIQWIIDDYRDVINLDILDIGTGTGCIPIALDKNLNKAKISSIDISKEATETAIRNANNNHARVNFITQNILATNSLAQPYDIIVSNPPYVRNLEKVEIQKNVLEHEPHLALFVDDNDPLIFYKKIAELALKHLKSDGVLYYEINQYLGNETVELLKNIGFKNVELKKDLFGNHRMIKAFL
ncbi:peptide chain release factor N(5)-glutamine methyltransferase [Wenyingzhuangia sp. IMCC45533]